MTDYPSLVFGGGCFWCLEAVFQLVPGVLSVEPGYAGGRLPSPSYQQVCTGVTGHAEVVRITWDPALVSGDDLLELFFATHDPTTPNRQGHDLGSQYRSIILTRSEAEAFAAHELIARLTREKIFPDPIITEVVPLERFWSAEPEHHNYYRNHPERSYCRAVITPKVRKLRHLLTPQT